jgi:tetratricopeptide (TPR) repeat protein
MNGRKNREKVTYLPAIAAALITLAVYLTALRNDFVIWDDDFNILDNLHLRRLDAAFFRWAFTDVSLSYWQPLNWITHAFDYALWGLHPAGHHLTTVLIHVVNTFLVVVLARRLFAAAWTAPGAPAPPAAPSASPAIAAGATGLLFGLHPLQVESVAWVTGRPGILSALFFILSIGSYLSHAVIAGGKGAGRGPYLRSLAFFACALASKPSTVALPVVLLVLDWFPLRRHRAGASAAALVVEKLPFIVLSAAAALLSVVAMRTAGAVAPLHDLPAVPRILIAARVLVLYLGKMAAPVGLSPFYPDVADPARFSAWSLGALLLLAAITALCIFLATRKDRPAFLAVWLVFLALLVPVVGFVKVRYVSMADRYAYLPLLGPLLLLGAAAAQLWSRSGWRGAPRRVLVIGAALGCLFLGIATLRQIAVWKDTVTLWTFVIGREGDRAPVAYVNRGVAYAEMHERQKAVADFTRAIDLSPSPLAYNNRGRVEREQGQLDKALEDFAQALVLDRSYHLAYNNRGLAYRDAGDRDRALRDYSAAIELRPDYAPAYTNRGVLYAEQGEWDKALEDLTSAIWANPYYTEAYTARGLVFEQQGAYERAKADLDAAVRLDPASADAYLNRGVVHERMGMNDRALADYSRAIELQPGDALAYRDRGELLLRTGQQDAGRADLRRACELGEQKACRELR